MMPSTATKTAFVVFRYVSKIKDAVDVVKMFFDKQSQLAEIQWQVEILDSSLPSGNVLLEGVAKAIQRADLVVVVAGEISHNVAFELGMAYALNKPLILLAPSNVVHEIPTVFSDISGVKFAVYDPDRIMKITDVLEAEFAALKRQAESERALALSPDYLIGLGDVLLFDGLCEEAISKYTSACELSPRNIQGLVRLGQAYATVGDLSRAEEVLRRAVALDSECTLALDALGQVLLDSGQYERAVDECYQPLISQYPRNESYYFKIAVAFVELQQPDKAADFLWRATKRLESGALLYDLAWTSIRASRALEGSAREEWVRKGLLALTNAIELEPDFRVRADRDQDFDCVRDDPGYPR